MSSEMDKNGSRSATLTVVILTYNEMLHVERCVRSAQRVADEVLVVDSYSTDDTVDRACRLGARVLKNSWKNYASQMNWALEHGAIATEWVMRLDADEYLDDCLQSVLRTALAAAAEDIGGFEINRRIRFMGREIRHGGMSPLLVTRLWRYGWARCEARWMDEHMVLDRGRVARLQGGIVDENLNSLTWWTEKHNHYASREAVDLLDMKYHLGLAEVADTGLNRQARGKRWLKNAVYSRLPLGVRPWLYFFYRSFVRLGVLDGGRGVLFHTLQGLWYRQLVDAKVAEVEDLMRNEDMEVSEAIRRVLKIDVSTVFPGNQA